MVLIGKLNHRVVQQRISPPGVKDFLRGQVVRLVSGNEPRALPPKDSSERTQAEMIEIFLLADRHGSAPGALTGPEKNLGSSPENRRANTRAGERKRNGDTNKSDIVRPKPPEQPDPGSVPRPEPASTAWYGIALHYLLPSHRPVSFGGSTKIKDCGTSPAAAQI